jgi:transposase
LGIIFLKAFPSQRSSELFAGITEDMKNRFFKLRGKRKKEVEYWFFDTTSISSYSKCLEQARYGKNKDHENLAQINLAVLFGEESMLPFYYRKLPGNISTVKNLITDIDRLEYKKIKLVMDRGFYSESNVNALFAAHMKFLIGVKIPLAYIQSALVPIRDSMRNFDHYHPVHDLHAYSETIIWKYRRERPYKGDMSEDERRMYLHIYYDGTRALGPVHTKKI